MSGDPILVEIDPQSWAGHVEKVEGWLGALTVAQATYRRLVEVARDGLKEPHIKEFVGDAAEVARRHEAKIGEFYAMIGRDPAVARKSAGLAVAEVRRAGGDLLDAAGGAAGSWADLNRVYQASNHAQASFAVAEQLALALGLKEMAEEAFRIENEQSKYHLLLREVLLKLAAIAILYKVDV